jgi:hypothetical protein
MDKNSVLKNSVHHIIPGRGKRKGTRKGSLAVLLLAERALEDQPGHPVKRRRASLEGPSSWMWLLHPCDTELRFLLL